MLYRLDPIHRPMVWGSELWVLSGYPQMVSIVSSGPCKGLSINELTAKYKKEFLGRGPYSRFGDSFPLLVKFLDVHAPLSVQVHPSEEFAQERQGLHGKTEMWYVVDAEPGAELMAGFSRDLTPQEYEVRVADGTITEVIAHHQIASGDVFFIPPGRVHALLTGAYIAEIQQASDSTYRIWDYNRPGLDGKPRPLHTALAKEVLDYSAHADYRTHYKPLKDSPVQLVSCEWFTTSLLDLDRPYCIDLSGLDSFVAVLCISGDGQVESATGVETLAAGSCILAPASENSIRFVPSKQGFKVLLCHI